jgi:GrpB-like predicted nucleotidyltransferase (UPF0157 family)
VGKPTAPSAFGVAFAEEKMVVSVEAGAHNCAGSPLQPAHMNRVQVVTYDPAWPDLFERVRAYVWPAVRDVARGVEHVGSTAVPGLSAKPVIDACIVVESRRDVSACIARLGTIGYEHKGDLGVPDREAFSRPAELPRHHLYLSPRDSLSLRNHLGLRDYLRAHPVAARQYGELKASLASRFPDDIDGYIAGKTEFILAILGKIGLTESEVDEIRRINRIKNLVRPTALPQPNGIAVPAEGT